LIEYKKLDAVRENCTAAKLLADMVSTSYGPTGMYKILLKDGGDFAVTKHIDLLSKDVETVHPVVRILVETARSVKSSTGDGFITTIILAGQLIERAWRLIEEGIHPNIISRGFLIASRKALEIISKHTIQVKSKDVYDAVAKTLLQTKLPHSLSEKISPALVNALLGTAQNFGGEVRFDRDMVIIEGRRGGSLYDTILVEGVVLHKRGVDRLMPRRIVNARIALIQDGFSIERPDIFTKVVLGKNFSIRDFYSTRRNILNEAIKPIFEWGVDVVICGGNIDEELRRIFASHGILFVRNVSKENMKIIAKAVGGTIVQNPKELTGDKLGKCGLVEERVVAALDRWLFFEKCPSQGVKSILVRGPTDNIVEEAKKALKDCIKTVEILLNLKDALIPGGGSIEIKTAEELRFFSQSLPGKEQYVVKVFADVLEQLPALLAWNAGLDHLSVLAELRRLNKNSTYGLDVLRREIVNPCAVGILDPVFVKRECISAAAEIASTIIRIDHTLIYPVKKKKKSPIPEPVKAVRRTSQLLKNIQLWERNK